MEEKNQDDPQELEKEIMDATIRLAAIKSNSGKKVKLLPFHLVTGPTDRVEQIAAQYAITVEDLASANPHIKALDSLRVGDVLNIPAARG